MATTKSKAAATVTKPVAVKVSEPATPTQIQLQVFDKGVRLFSEQKFAESADLLRQVAKGPALHVADRARGYLQVCERRLDGPKMEFHSADDHFSYAMERMNARDFDKAKHHLSSALKMEPQGDHILYTLAISCGLAGDGRGAYENLKLAIEVEPRNRMHARQDSDFAVVAERFPELRSLVEA